MKEIKRIAYFDSGEVICKCGAKFNLYFNGGELDSYQCICGLFYKTESRRVDLVVYAPEETEAKHE